MKLLKQSNLTLDLEKMEGQVDKLNFNVKQ